MCEHDAPDSVPETTCAQSPDAHRRAVVDRRTFLRRSIGSLLGLTLGSPMLSLLAPGDQSGLSGLFTTPSLADVPPLPTNPNIKSIVVLWMNGGPSQLDTFDPKPSSSNGGEFKAIDTAIKGVQICEHLPNVASVMDRMALIRCMKTSEGNHDRARTLMRTGFKPTPTVAYPGLGAVLTYELGELESPIPQNVAINAPGQKAGVLGMGFDPFNIGNPAKEVDNLNPPRGMTNDRIDRRLEIMAAQDNAFRERLGGRSYEVAGHQAVMQSAVRFMRAEETRAFSIADEPESVKNAYGSSRFGQGCLMARRLVEAGVKFVEVTLNGWDTHEDNFTRTQNLLGDLDPAMATLIRDLEERDLLDSTLVVCMGEFGRTPRINAKDGRDHFTNAWSVALAGGGIKAGTVIGETSSDGMKIVGNSVGTADLFRTILWSAGIDPDYEYYSPKGRPMKYADGGKLITELLG